MSSKKISLDLSATPFLPDAIYEKLPTFLRECCAQFPNRRERDVFLTLALTVISGCLPGVKGRYYQRRYYANLFSLVVAPPANGKGVIRFVKHLGMALHRRLISQSTQEPVEQNGSEDGARSAPRREQSVKMHFIPADTSAAMLLQHLQTNDGRGTIIESEADTLVNSLNQDWGGFTDRLRAGFEHEPISYSRKTGEVKNIEIPCPRLSVALTGTPKQAQRLIPSAENGLASRFLYYIYRQPYLWIDPRPCPDCADPDDFFSAKGEELLQISDHFELNPLEVTLADNQWEQLTTSYREHLDQMHVSHGDDLAATVLRMGVVCFRIAMILSALRGWENKSEAAQLVCTDDDFNSAMSLGSIYLQHSSIMMQIIPESDAQAMVNRKDRYYAELPVSFTRAEGMVTAERLRIAERSAGRYLDYFVKAGKLIQPGHGQYQKA